MARLMRDALSEEMMHYLCSDDEYLGDEEKEYYGEVGFCDRKKTLVGFPSTENPYKTETECTNHRVH